MSKWDPYRQSQLAESLRSLSQSGARQAGSWRGAAVAFDYRLEDNWLRLEAELGGEG